MNTKKLYTMTLLLVFFTSIGSAQILARDAVNGNTLATSMAFIDGTSNPNYSTAAANYAGKGILFPTLDLTVALGSAPFDQGTVGTANYNPNNYDGLMVYNTGTGAVTMGTSTIDVAPGFYYYSNNTATTISWNTGVWEPLSGSGGGGIPVYNDAGTRDAGITSPTEGMVVYQKDTDKLHTYDGMAWNEVQGSGDTKGFRLSGSSQSIPHAGSGVAITSYTTTVRNDFPGAISGGVFTVPPGEDGWYAINGNIRMGDITNVSVFIYVNGSKEAYNKTNTTYGSRFSSASTGIYLSAGDTVSLNGAQESGSAATLEDIRFSAVKLTNGSGTGNTPDNLGDHTATQDLVLDTHGISDTNTELGTAGQVLSSTGTGIDWIDASGADAKGFRLNGTTQSIPHSSATIITSYITTVRNDFSGAISSGVFTVPVGESGWYNISGYLSTNTVNSNLIVDILLNNVKITSQRDLSSGSSTHRVSASTNIYLNQGDIIKLAGAQYSGSTVNLVSGNFSAVKLTNGSGTGNTPDNLGNHTATQDLDLATNKLVGNGGTEGIYIAANGKVGIGTATPTAILTVGDSSTGGGALLLNRENNTGTEGGQIMFAAGTTGESLFYIDSYSSGTSQVLRFRSTNNSSILSMLPAGNVGLGTTSPTQKLHVIGNILASGTITPDYVFQKYYDGESALKTDYTMKSLSEIEAFTRANKHLPGVPSAQEVEDKGGILVNRATEINLEKIEELYLHTIEQQKQIERLQAQVKALLETKE